MSHWTQEARYEVAVIRDGMPTKAEMDARVRAVLECFGNPILDPSMQTVKEGDDDRP